MEIGTVPYVRAGAVRKVLILCVSDDGLGISAALLPHIFDLHAQSSRTIAASSGGPGIGLAVIRAIAHAHGGAVSTSNADPGGMAANLRSGCQSLRHRTHPGAPDAALAAQVAGAQFLSAESMTARNPWLSSRVLATFFARESPERGMMPG